MAPRTAAAAPEPTLPGLSIGRLAKAVGVGIDTIRFYERIGLLPAAKRSASGYRRYEASDTHTLAFIRRAQDLGFSLQEVAALLKLSQRGGSVARTRAMAAEKLAGVRQKLAELQRLASALETLVEKCPGSGDPASCPIIGALCNSADPNPASPNCERRKARKSPPSERGKR
jgi:MerR family transcriptional regulator, copper efflux regulator